MLFSTFHLFEFTQKEFLHLSFFYCRNPEEERRVDITDSEDIAHLFKLIELELPRESSDSQRVCACLGNPQLEVYQAQNKLGTITIHHGTSLRCQELGFLSNMNICETNHNELVEYFAGMGIDEYVRMKDEAQE